MISLLSLSLSLFLSLSQTHTWTSSSTRPASAGDPEEAGNSDPEASSAARRKKVDLVVPTNTPHLCERTKSTFEGPRSALDRVGICRKCCAIQDSKKDDFVLMEAWRRSTTPHLLRVQFSGLISPYSGRACVKLLRSSYTGLSRPAFRTFAKHHHTIK